MSVCFIQQLLADYSRCIFSEGNVYSKSNCFSEVFLVCLLKFQYFLNPKFFCCPSKSLVLYTSICRFCCCFCYIFCMHCQIFVKLLLIC